MAALADGRIPFHEPGLPEAYATQHAAGRIVPSAEIPGDGLELVVICVGTPIDDTGSTDVSQVERVPDPAPAPITTSYTSPSPALVTGPRPLCRRYRAAFGRARKNI